MVTIVTLLVLYCFCQVCTEIEYYEKTIKVPVPLQSSDLIIQQKEKRKHKSKCQSTKTDKDKALFNLHTQSIRPTNIPQARGKNINFSDKLIKFRSTGQINVNQTRRINCPMQRNEMFRQKSPITDARRMLNWNREPNISEITPLTFVEEYIQSKSIKLPGLPTKEEASPVKESYAMKTEVPRSLINPRDKVDSQSVQKSAGEEPHENKKKDFLSRIDMLYKSKFNKEKKRKLWNLDRKIDK